MHRRMERAPRPTAQILRTLVRTRAQMLASTVLTCSGPTSAADLTGADLSRVNLIRAQFNMANLSGARFLLANLSGATFFLANLSRANLNGANLSEASLRDANLSEASLMVANLSEANLSRGNLGGADLSKADLSRSDLRGANLHGLPMLLDSLRRRGFFRSDGTRTVHHGGPSTIGIDTLFRSKGKIPEVFLRGCGVPE